MTDKHKLDVIEIITAQDGQFNDEINAYVTAYPTSENTVVVEVEYCDVDNDLEVIETVSYTVTIND